MKAIAILALFALAGVASATDVVVCKITVDNTAKEVKKQLGDIYTEAANELCKIPKGNVYVPTSSMKDTSSIFDSKTEFLLYCYVPAGMTHAQVYNNAKKNFRDFADELEDETDWPEIEVEKVTCDPKKYTTSGAAPSGRRLLQAPADAPNTATYAEGTSGSLSAEVGNSINAYVPTGTNTTSPAVQKEIDAGAAQPFPPAPKAAGTPVASPAAVTPAPVTATPAPIATPAPVATPVASPKPSSAQGVTASGLVVLAVAAAAALL